MDWGQLEADEVRASLFTGCFDRESPWEIWDIFWLDRWRQVQAEKARGPADPIAQVRIQPWG